MADARANRTAKDSVFTDLFSSPRNVAELCRALDPAFIGVTADDIADITLNCVLMNGQYNDLGFTALGRSMFLTEAQSTFTFNVLVRLYIYHALTLRGWLADRGENLFKNSKVRFPAPKLYVICTGGRNPRGRKREEISLAEEFFPGERQSIDVRAEVIYDGEEGDIISQYVGFCRVWNETAVRLGRTGDAVREAIKICAERNYLREYLSARRKEVVDMIMSIYTDEELRNMAIAESRAEGKVEGRVEGFARGIVEMGREFGLSAEKIISNLIDKLSCSRADAERMLREI